MKDRYIHLALQQASLSNMDVRVGAVLVKQKHVLGTGYNRKDHPFLRTGKVEKLHFNFGMHAEVAALHNVEDTYGTTMYVARLRKDDSIGMAMPCRSCHEYIVHLGIKRVVYSDNIGCFHKVKVG